MRRSGRIPKEIPILLIGTDLNGITFSEPTKTVVLSLHGAGIVSKHKLCPEQELVLRWPERNKEADIRVVGQIGADTGQYTYGVAFFESVKNFWEVEFPPVSAIEQELGTLLLVCNGCQEVVRIDDNSMEADVVATNTGIVRYCKNCGSSTFWKPRRAGSPASSQPLSPASSQLRRGGSLASTQPEPAAHAPALQPSFQDASMYSSAPPAEVMPGGLPQPAPLSDASSSPLSERVSDSASGLPPSPGASVMTLPAPEKKPAAALVNRRKYPRVKVNYLAMVRFAGREDVAQCEDVSRGGLRFKSSHRYFERDMIEVAAPYSTGQPAIFVMAHIVFVQELPEQKLYRYGVSFVKSVRPRDSF